MIVLRFLFVPRRSVYAVFVPATVPADVLTSVIRFNLNHNVVLLSINY